MLFARSPPPPAPPLPPPALQQQQQLLLLVSLLAAWLPAPTQQISQCGHCVCDKTTITCGYKPGAEAVSDVAQLSVSSRTVESIGLRASSFRELYINCNSALRDQRLRRSLLAGFSNISRVNIVKCGLVSIDRDAFTDVPQLREFDASDNRLATVPELLFADKEMKLVKLSENRGIRLLPRSFDRLQLRQLVLSRCDLTEFPLESLSKIRRLTPLTLSHNRIKILRRTAMSVIRHLDTFYLDGNPISCTCPNRWLPDSIDWERLSPSVAEAQSTGKSKVPRCNSPYGLYDIELTKVDKEKFLCTPPQIRSIDVQLTSSTAQLTCSAWSEEAGQLEWTFQQQQPASDSSSSYGSYRIPSVKYQGTGQHFSRLVHRAEGAARQRYSVQAKTRDGQSANLSLVVVWPLQQPPLQQPPAASGSEEATPQNPASAAAAPSAAPGSELSPKVGRDYFSRKQFTLVEMILAVIGTFMSTTLMFLLGCQFCRWYARRDKKRWTSYGTQHYTCNYTSSQRPGSHEYDVPRIDQPCLPKPPPPPPPTGELEFLDYNGHRMLFNR